MKNKLCPDIVPLLLAWYEENKRDLPWRHTKDPYAIWISEIMLQQTRCEAVKPYYHRFLRELSNVSALAKAEDEKLLKLWEGLGYYSRARNLKKAAGQIVERHGGRLPNDYRSLLALTGIGEYTAGAIASIAFGIPVPAVDGNVLRVITRLTMDERDITCPKLKADVKEAIEEIMPKENPGDFNQALIELGATLCGPGHPALCGSCPLVMHCHALKEGATDLLPTKKKPPARKILPRTLLILKNDGKTALSKREEKGLLAGMYEIPAIEGYVDENEVKAYLQTLGLVVKDIKKLPEAKHVFTHLEWHMQAYFINVEGETNVFPFYEKKTLSSLPLPGAFAAYRKYLLE